MSEEDKELARLHWLYSEAIIKKCMAFALELTEYAYRSAMIHGIKHGEQNRDRKAWEETEQVRDMEELNRDQ